MTKSRWRFSAVVASISGLLELAFALSTTLAVIVALVAFAHGEWSRFGHFALLGGLFLLMDINATLSRRRP